MKEYLYELMYEMLPHELRNSTVYQNVLKAYAIMFDMAWEKVEQAARNIYLDTAVEILPTHARDVGVSVVGMSDRDAREVIRSAWLSLTDVVQWDDILSVINAYTNGDADLHRADIKGQYEIEFTSVYGIPAQMKALETVLKRMIGAEYTWQYLYKYMTWGDRMAYHLTEGEWEALGLTVEEMRSYDG